ncbi:hypothetical protein CYY_003167 [Polysphondylium violaceum]|uniref:PA14 domain-containing protein n=1 Tax=Polysphondylium violaceum TaxID=133409 RepID=A0A8J4UUJ0_9MYCE|nr:hypothetical protein CYY_003167 [Polysphondylium violaceum]
MLSKYKQISVLLLILFFYNIQDASSQATLELSGIIRDTTPSRNPDFEWNIVTAQGIVLSTLGADHTPTYCCGDNSYPPIMPVVHNQTTFYAFFHDVPDVNIKIPYTLTLTPDPNNPNVYTYTNLAFFPIDGQGFDNPTNYPNETVYRDANGTPHNFHFCFEVHTQFEYQPGYVFNFVGDDDVWVFINNQLVVDLGGIHRALNVSLNVDTLGLTIGQSYPFDFFYCERHTTKSEISISTSLPFICPFFDGCGVCQGDNSSCCLPSNCDNKPGLDLVCLTQTCTDNMTCTASQLRCNDNDPCTVDNCFFGAGCSFSPYNCRDNNPCTYDYCSPTNFCVFVPIGGCVACENTVCQSDDLCIPLECHPLNGSTCISNPVICDDDNPCTMDSCYQGQCIFTVITDCGTNTTTTTTTTTDATSTTAPATTAPATTAPATTAPATTAPATTAPATTAPATTASATTGPDTTTTTTTSSTTGGGTGTIPTTTSTSSTTTTTTTTSTIGSAPPPCVCPTGYDCRLEHHPTVGWLILCTLQNTTSTTSTSTTSLPTTTTTRPATTGQVSTTVGSPPTTISSTSTTGSATTMTSTTGATTMPPPNPCLYSNVRCRRNQVCSNNYGVPLCIQNGCLTCEDLGCHKQGLFCKFVRNRLFSRDPDCCEYIPTCSN